MNRSMWIVVGLILVVCLSAYSSASANRVTWKSGNTGDWNVASNWNFNWTPSDGWPTTDVYEARTDKSGAVLNYNSGTTILGEAGLMLSDTHNMTSTLNVNGGTLLSAGTWSSLSHGNFPGTYGIVNIAPGATFGTTGSSALMRAAYYGEATINVEGTLQTEGTLYLTHGGATTVNLIGAGEWLNSAALSFDYGGGEAVLNFEPGATGSFTNTGEADPHTYFLGLYTGDDLTFDGDNSLLFDDVFQVNGSTLSLVSTSEAVPEPSTFALALVGMFGLAFYVRQRRRK